MRTLQMIPQAVPTDPDFLQSETLHEDFADDPSGWPHTLDIHDAEHVAHRKHHSPSAKGCGLDSLVVSTAAVKKHKIPPPADHPLRLRSLALSRMKRAQTLEVWFDAGFRLSQDGEVAPVMKAPFGYEQFSGPLLKCVKNDIIMWPVRFDLADREFVQKASWKTLYHYTYERSFNAFIEVFGSSSSQDIPVEDLPKMFVQHLVADIRERDTHGEEPILTLFEPVKWDSKIVVVQKLLGQNNPSGISTCGKRWTSFCKYCIAFAAPVYVWCPLPHTVDDPMAKGNMRLDLSTLDSANMAARRAKEGSTSKDRVAKNEAAEKNAIVSAVSAYASHRSSTQSSRKGFLALLDCLFGGSSVRPHYNPNASFDDLVDIADSETTTGKATRKEELSHTSRKNNYHSHLRDKKDQRTDDVGTENQLRPANSEIKYRHALSTAPVVAVPENAITPNPTTKSRSHWYG